MANPEHVERLKKGVVGWNIWRRENLGIQPDLGDSNLSDADLSDADLSCVNLSRADLNGVNLSRVDLSRADLRDADLHDADLSRAYLRDTNLRRTDLSNANLSDAILRSTDLRSAGLRDTNLRRASFRGTIIAQNDLRATKGLAEIKHEGPSHIELFTIQLPQDDSALHFLRGAGIPEEWIDLWRVTAIHPIQYHSLFISYSSKDEMLAHRLYADLQARGVRCWFAPEDLKIGSKFRQHIDEAIHLQDKLLLLLSEHSIASTWVEAEVEAALEKEDRQQREVLFPIRLDNVVMQTPKAWAATLRRMRNIGDFSTWTDPQAYQSAFDRLLRDLKQD